MTTKIVYRAPALPTAGNAADLAKDAPLTNTEIDANFYGLAAAIGNLTLLETGAKTDLVTALNEVSDVAFLNALLFGGQ